MRPLGLYQLLEAPKIILCNTSAKARGGWDRLEGTQERPTYILAHLSWFIAFRPKPILGTVRQFRQEIRELRKRHVHLIILANTLRDKIVLSLFGIKCFHINHNIHVNEHIYRPLNETKKYKAVYSAQAAPYKRIHLAAEINSLYIVTFWSKAYWWRTPELKEKFNKIKFDLHKFEPRISHCDYNKDWIDQREINRILNRSHCGLALSKAEGAMLASIEYLMAGIPVVSTKSQGGRNEFFDRKYVKIVNDNPHAVKKGVDSIISKQIPPNLIRKSTLKKVNKRRKKFYRIVKKIAKEHNQSLPNYQKFYNHVWGGPEGIEKRKVDFIDMKERSF